MKKCANNQCERKGQELKNRCFAIKHQNSDGLDTVCKACRRKADREMRHGRGSLRERMALEGVVMSHSGVSDG